MVAVWILLVVSRLVAVVSGFVLIPTGLLTISQGYEPGFIEALSFLLASLSAIVLCEIAQKVLR
jgi:hypothetical protein